jgi:peptidylprolyl isomerase
MRHKSRKSHSLRNAIIAIIVLMIVVSLVVVAYQMNSGRSANSDRVLLVTSMGNITIQLYDDMPITTGNFKNLVSAGVYDRTIFHRVAPGFVIQGGDLTAKSITWQNITDELPNKHSNVRGSVAMAKTDQPNSATSEFFIDLNDSNVFLNSNYSVFGTIIAGMDVVDAISHVPFSPVLSANDGKPLTDVTLIQAKFAS